MSINSDILNSTITVFDLKIGKATSGIAALCLHPRSAFWCNHNSGHHQGSHSLDDDASGDQKGFHEMGCTAAAFWPVVCGGRMHGADLSKSATATDQSAAIRCL
jgi:hypothetical protein